jgi:hypothetical protein
MKKKLILALVFSACFMMMSTFSFGHSYDRYDDGHPLRLIAYVLHPVGIAVEYAIERPIHHLVSLPYCNVIFGHVSYENDVLWSWE